MTNTPGRTLMPTLLREVSQYLSVLAEGIAAVMLLGGVSVPAQTVRIDTTAPVNTIRPREAVGAGIDRIPVEAIDRDLTKQALAPVLQSGWQPVTYRQNTELAVEAWHWNTEGSWSGGHGQGYFTGSSTSTGSIGHSFGSPTPH